MTIQTKKKYSGQQRTAVLDGNVAMEDGNNRLVIRDGSEAMLSIDKNGMIVRDGTTDMLVVNKNGIILNDGTTNRMIIGLLPDGTIGVAISKVGVDVFGAFS